MTRPAFLNALTVLAAVGGSTNAIVRLLAVARRAGVELTLRDFDEVASRIPLLLDLKPSGQGYVGDFHRAGGVPTLLRALEGELDTSHLGVAECADRFQPVDAAEDGSALVFGGQDTVTGWPAR